jgi:hypothetical protein
MQVGPGAWDVEDMRLITREHVTLLDGVFTCSCPVLLACPHIAAVKTKLGLSND